jgi:hypothetical protein
MELSDEIFPLYTARDWDACHQRLDEAEPADSREERVTIAYWRSAVLARQGRYEEALSVIEASRGDAFSQCAVLWDRAKVLCLMGRFAEAIDTLRSAPFGEEIDTFPGMTYEAIFLYCWLLKRSGREPPPNLLAALPDDFRTMLYDKRFASKADIVPPVAPA